MLATKKSLGRKTLLFIAITYSFIVTAAFLLPIELFKVPSETLPKLKIPYVDKWIHGILFFGLVYLWQWYFYKRNTKVLSGASNAILLIIMIFYGIIVEVFQDIMPVSRTADAFDVIADLLGAVLGIFAFKIFRHKFHS